MKNKWAKIVGDKQFKVEEVDFPAVNGNPIVKVTHCGICGSDVHYWQDSRGNVGTVPGHEYTGIIEDPGLTDFKKGDRVLGYSQNSYNEPCGVCDTCLSGNRDACTNRIIRVGIGNEPERPGAYSEYVTWFPKGFFKLPDNVSNEEAATVEPMAVGLHAVKFAGIQTNDNVLIMGGGIIAQACAEWARACGAGVITMTETNDKKLKTIKDFGIVNHVLNGLDPEIDQQVKSIYPDGIDVFFDCVALNSTVALGLRNIKRIGTGVMVGVNMHELSIDYFPALLKHVKLFWSKGHVPNDFQAVLQSMASGKLSMKKYITKHIKLDDVQAAFEHIDTENEDFKVMIEF